LGQVEQVIFTLEPRALAVTAYFLRLHQLAVVAEATMIRPRQQVVLAVVVVLVNLGTLIQARQELQIKAMGAAMPA
jgi:hypothetical protein